MENKWEKACREFLKGCSCTKPTNLLQEECPECLKAFCDHLRELKEKEECIVYGCTNKKHEGNFIGNICCPCYKIITTGNLEQPSKNFIHKLALENLNLKGEIDCQKFQQ